MAANNVLRSSETESIIWGTEDTVPQGYLFLKVVLKFMGTDFKLYLNLEKTQTVLSSRDKASFPRPARP